MITNFWETIVATIIGTVIGGLIVAFANGFWITPLIEKYQKEGKPTNTRLGLIITKLAAISLSSYLKIVVPFIVGIIFTIAVAMITHTNLANVDFLSSHPSSCGVNRTGIIGQVINIEYGYGSTITVTTSPPSSSVIADEDGYFSICDISLGSSGQQFTVTAVTDYLVGSVDISVAPNETTNAIIRMQRR